MQRLFEHIPHSHHPQNVNQVHAQEVQEGDLNTRIAVVLTRSVGTMWTAYSFALLACVGFFALLGVLPPFLVLLVAFVSQTFLQLVLLPVIMVGQNVLSRKSELQADETFKTSQRSFYDIESVLTHLDKQDEAILEILKRLDSPKGVE